MQTQTISEEEAALMSPEERDAGGIDENGCPSTAAVYRHDARQRTTENLALSRVELAERLHALRGGEPKPKQKDGLYTNWIIGPWQWSTYKQQWTLITDPTRDIGEAWALWAKVREKADFDIRYDFYCEVEEHATEVFAMTAEEAALWICCTVFWAVEGKRVELKPE